MELAQRGIARPRTIAIVNFRWPRLPLYLRFLFGVAVSILVLVAGVMALARQAESLADRFAPYNAILPGQPQSILTAQGFSCQDQDGDAAKSGGYCTRTLASGPFSLIRVDTRRGMVSHTYFYVRGDDALLLGDLVYLWGRPNFGLMSRKVLMMWPARGIVAWAWSEDGQFSYFLPVLRITFGRAVDITQDAE